MSLLLWLGEKFFVAIQIHSVRSRRETGIAFIVCSSHAYTLSQPTILHIGHVIPVITSNTLGGPKFPERQWLVRYKVSLRQVWATHMPFGHSIRQY